MTALSLAATCRGFKAASCRRTPYEAVWIRKLEVHDSPMRPLDPDPVPNAADGSPFRPPTAVRRHNGDAFRRRLA